MKATITVRTVELIRLIHDGLALLEQYAEAGDVEGAEELGNACESLLSAVVFVLKEPKGKIPAEMQYRIGTIREHINKQQKAA